MSQILPLKRVARVRFSSVDKKTNEDELPVRLCNYTDVYYRDSITPDLPFMEATATPNELREFSLHKGDVLITKDSESPDDIGIPSYVSFSDKQVLCGYHLAQLRPVTPLLNGRFLFWWMASDTMREELSARANGITRFGLKLESIAAAPIRVPGMEEQRAIADFLDRETARIDALIAKRRYMTNLLEERLSALTSGLLWEKKPYPYEVRRLKHLNGLPTSGNRDHSSFTFSESGVPCLRGLNVRPGRIDVRELLRISQEDHVRHAPTALRPGDLVIVRSGLAGSAVAIPESFGECNCVDLVVVRRSEHLHSRYLEYVVNSREAQEQVVAEESGALLKHFNAVDAGELRIPYRPLEVQREIVRVLDEQTEREGAAMGRLRGQASLMQERRQALITAAVTGQMDIPSAA